MLHFDELHAQALARKGPGLEAGLPTAASDEVLARRPDARYLAGMTRAVFNSGFVWKVVEAKWDGFEEVFQGFDPGILSVLPEEIFAQLAEDTRIIRNKSKVATVRDNAQFVADIAASYGSFGHWLAAWPGDDIVGLWEVLGKRGSRLGGNTGGFFLRQMGKDTFLFTADVTTALQRMGLVGKNPHTKSSRRAAQQAFNTWAQQSGRPLCEISRILACTVPG